MIFYFRLVFSRPTGCQTVTKDIYPGLIDLWTPGVDTYNVPLFSAFVGVITPYMEIILATNCLRNINLSASPNRIFQSASVDGETTTFVWGLQLNKILKIRCNAMGVFLLDSKHACCKYLMQAMNMTVR